MSEILYLKDKILENINCYSREIFFKKHLTETEQNIILSVDGDFLNQKIYNFINNTETPKCVCGKRLKFKSYKEGYLQYCSNSCKSKNQIRSKSQYEKMMVTYKKTMMEKYGVENSFQLDHIKELIFNNRDEEFYRKRNEKSKKVWMEKYGVDNPNKCESVIEKRKKTNLEKYGNAFGKSCKTNRSKGEIEIQEFLQKLNIYAFHTRSVISPYEIDIYVPDYKVGIEYNGDYWHAVHKVDHLFKKNICEKSGIKLIQIFEKDYKKYKNEILENILRVLNNEDYTEDFYIFSEKDDIKLQDASWPPYKEFISITEPEKVLFNGDENLYYYDCGKYILKN